jgi:hypothetical protein
MNLEQMLKELEQIQQMDMSNLTPEQLTEVLDKLSGIVSQSEETIINQSLIDLNKSEEDTDEDN